MTINDIVPLFTQPVQPDLDYRQGVIAEWDSESGTNTVRIGDADFPNLPIIGGVEATNIQPGNVVGILRVRSQYFILGRIATSNFLTDVKVASLRAVGDIATGNSEIRIRTADWSDQGQTEIVLDVGNPGGGSFPVTTPAKLETLYDGAFINDAARLTITGPSFTGSGGGGVINLLASSDGTGNTLNMQHDEISLSTDFSPADGGPAKPVRIQNGVLFPRSSDIDTGDPTGTIETVAMRAIQDIDLTDETFGVTTFTAETNSATVAFTAPPSGVVEIEVSANIDIETTAARAGYVGWELRTGKIVGSGTIVQSATDENCAKVGTGSVRILNISSRTTLISGLTAGAYFNVRTMKRIDATTNIVAATIRDRRLTVRPEM